MKKFLFASALLALSSLAGACPLKAGTFANGALPSIPAGLKPECGIVMRLFKSSIQEEMGPGSWMELYSSPKKVNLANIEQALQAKGYTTLSNNKDIKKAIADMQKEFAGMVGKDSQTDARALISKDGNTGLFIVEISVPNDNMIIVASPSLD